MFEVGAADALATALCPAFTAGVNLVRATFLDPGVRELYADWDTVAREAVAGLRATAGANAGNPRLADLVTELTDAARTSVSCGTSTRSSPGSPASA